VHRAAASNLFKRETCPAISSDQQLPDPRAQALGLWTPEIRDAIKTADGSVQDLEGFQRNLGRYTVQLGAAHESGHRNARTAALHRSEPILNLFMASPNIGQLSSMYMYAWNAD